MVCSYLYPSLRWIPHASDGDQIVSTRQLVPAQGLPSMSLMHDASYIIHWQYKRYGAVSVDVQYIDVTIEYDSGWD
jgi:hypothetical protein